MLVGKVFLQFLFVFGQVFLENAQVVVKVPEYTRSYQVEDAKLRDDHVLMMQLD